MTPWQPRGLGGMAGRLDPSRSPSDRHLPPAKRQPPAAGPPARPPAVRRVRRPPAVRGPRMRARPPVSHHRWHGKPSARRSPSSPAN